jgi:hypothetical protein
MEVVDLVHRMVGNMGEDVAQPCLGINAIKLGRTN